MIKKAFKVYFLAFIFSQLFSPLFNKLYIWLFKPITGPGLYFILPSFLETVLNGTLFGFYLFLPFFVFSLLKTKQWLILFIGIIIPLLIALAGGKKDLFWSLLLGVVGWLLAQLILFIQNQKKLS